MAGTPFLEPFMLKTRRLYVLHTSPAVAEARHAGLVEALRAQAPVPLDIVSVDLRTDPSLSRLLRLRDEIRSMPPEIRQRTVLGYGAGAHVALILSLLAALDEAYVIAPDPLEKELPFDLGLVAKAPVPGTARRFLFSAFAEPAAQRLLRQAFGWSDCIAVPEDFRAELDDPRFTALLSQICGKQAITLPKEFIRLTEMAA